MTLSIDFAPAEEARLKERATAEGKDVQTFVREAALERAQRPSLLEILGPVHQATEAAGLSVDQFDAMADRARAEARQRREAPDAGKQK